MTGEEFLHAFILGVEVECRIGNAVYPAHYDIGWHITAQPVCSALRRLSASARPRRAADDLGAGHRGHAGVGVPRDVRHHVQELSSRAAPRRTACPRRFSRSRTSRAPIACIEAPRGFANVLSTARNYDEITKGLGEHLRDRAQYLQAVRLRDRHPPGDRRRHAAAQRARAERGRMIERVELSVHPLVLELTGKKTPQVGLEGKFSVFHSVAVAIIRGAARRSRVHRRRGGRPARDALRDSVIAAVDRASARTRPTSRSGSRTGACSRQHVEHALGSLERPMSDTDLGAKFRSLAEGILRPSKRRN